MRKKRATPINCCAEPDQVLKESTLFVDSAILFCGNCEYECTFFIKGRDATKEKQLFKEIIFGLIVPPVVMLPVETASTPDDTTHQFHILNPTEETLFVRSTPGFFQTVDKDTGVSAEYGPSAVTRKLKPGELKKLGDVLGWEWDGALRLELEIGLKDTLFSVSLDLKDLSNRIVDVPGSGKGRFVFPQIIRILTPE